MGYVGYSMSENAQLAYDMGEKPKSAWSKNAMISAIRTSICENNLKLDGKIIEGMNKSDVFDLFFAESSRHHVGAYYTLTSFYNVDVAFLRTLTNQKLMVLYVAQRKTKNSSIKSIPRYCEVEYLDHGYTKVKRGYIKGEWFTGNDGKRKNVNSRGFNILVEIDTDALTDKLYPELEF